MQKRLCNGVTLRDELKAMNEDSSEMKRLAGAVASVTATMAEMFNEKLMAASGRRSAATSSR
jgi:hypothetical protein